MKKIWGLLCCLLLFGGAVHAQSAEEAVASAVEAFNQAMIDRDKAALEEMTAAELSYGHSGGTIEDKTAFIEGVVKGPFRFLTITTEDPSVAVTGKTAIVRHIFVSEGRNSGKPAQVRIGIMMIWQKKKGQWQLVARQAYKL